MNRRLFCTSLAAAVLAAVASRARPTLANRPLPDNGDSGYRSEGKSNKNKNKRRNRRNQRG